MLKTEYPDVRQRFNHLTLREKTQDGAELYMQRWDPSGSVKAVVVLVHGLGEHSTRYISWANKFNAKGIAVIGFDLRGHGKSSGKRGHARHFKQFINDIGFVLDKAFEIYPELPVFLYGHSFGGNLAANYTISELVRIKGLILTSPWFKLIDQPSPVKVFVVKYLRKIFPQLLFRTRLKPEYISRDLRIVHDYKTDALVHDHISVNLGFQAMHHGLHASKCIYRINVPLLVMHGLSDRITDPECSKEFVQNASNKTTFIGWEGGYHELHHDLDRDMVFDTIYNWLIQQL